MRLIFARNYPASASRISSHVLVSCCTRSRELRIEKASTNLCLDKEAVSLRHTAKLTPIQVLERLQLRLEQRMESLQRVKLDGYHVVISELETELDLLRRAQRYLED